MTERRNLIATERELEPTHARGGIELGRKMEADLLNFLVGGEKPEKGWKGLKQSLKNRFRPSPEKQQELAKKEKLQNEFRNICTALENLFKKLGDEVSNRQFFYGEFPSVAFRMLESLTIEEKALVAQFATMVAQHNLASGSKVGPPEMYKLRSDVKAAFITNQNLAIKKGRGAWITNQDIPHIENDDGKVSFGHSGTEENYLAISGTSEVRLKIILNFLKILLIDRNRQIQKYDSLLINTQLIGELLKPRVSESNYSDAYRDIYKSVQRAENELEKLLAAKN